MSCKVTTKFICKLFYLKTDIWAKLSYTAHLIRKVNPSNGHKVINDCTLYSSVRMECENLATGHLLPLLCTGQE